MAMMEDFADATTCALSDFSGSLSGSDADVLSSTDCAFANITGSVDGVEGDEIAGAFADALGCCSRSPGSALADIPGSTTNVSAGATGLALA